jgi:hypothetical protein
MADLQKDIATIQDPSGIKNALLASSPYVLRKAFAADPTISRLIAAGEKVIPIIEREILGQEHLNEITLSAFAFIIENVKAELAPQILGAQFRTSMENPGPFFIHFAAHAMRSGLRMPIKPLEMVYSRAELIEIQNKLP